MDAEWAALMAIGFDFRDELNNPDWTIARGALIEQIDRMLAAINASPGVTGSATANSALVANASGVVGFSPIGQWVNAPFNVNDYNVLFDAGSTWVVAPVNGSSVSPLQYTVIGSTMILNVVVYSSVLTIVAGTTSVLSITIPGGYRTSNRLPSSVDFPGQTRVPCLLTNDGATWLQASFVARPNSSVINVINLSGSFSTSSLVTVYGQIAFEVVPQ